MMDAKPNYVTEHAVADLLGLSVRTLQKMRVNGDGPPFYKFGRRVLYDTEEVLNWAATRRRTSTSYVEEVTQ